MNETLQAFARQQLLDGLSQLPNDWQDKFKLMYARNGGARSVDEAKAMTIADVVSKMPEGKLDWAMCQVENSIRKRAAQQKEQKENETKD